MILTFFFENFQQKIKIRKKESNDEVNEYLF